jgi:hypothetical protein
MSITVVVYSKEEGSMVALAFTVNALSNVAAAVVVSA